MFKCPPDTLIVFAQVLQEYGFESLPDLKAPVVLDIGANVGAFSWAARRRWPDARVFAYEPHPVTFALLQDNVAEWQVEAHQAAVVHPKTTETVRLFEGKNATTEASIRDDVRWPHLSQDLEHWHHVPALDADTLPPCDVMKVDTEGSEVEIITGYKHLSGVKVLLVECHAVGGDLKGQMTRVAQLADQAGLGLVDVRGTTMRFVRQLENNRRVDIEGDWWHVRAVGGEEYVGQCVRESGDVMFLAHPRRCLSDRMVVPIPVPGGKISASSVDPPASAFLWTTLHLPEREEEVRWSSRMRMTHEEVARFLTENASV